MNIAEFVSIAAVIAAAQVMATWWLKAKMEGSIKHAYDKRLEQLRSDQRNRERATLVAELLALWISDTELKDASTKRRLNQLTWEATLWLPEELALDINERLANAVQSKDVRQVVLDVRTHLLGPHRINYEHVVFFT